MDTDLDRRVRKLQDAILEAIGIEQSYEGMRQELYQSAHKNQVKGKTWSIQGFKFLMYIYAQKIDEARETFSTASQELREIDRVDALNDVLGIPNEEAV